MGGAFRGIGAALGVVGALATLVELYLETGFVDTVRRVYIETVLTDARYVGGAERLGLKVYALSKEGAWCGENVVFKMTGSESGKAVSRHAAEFFMKRLAERINDEDSVRTRVRRKSTGTRTRTRRRSSRAPPQRRSAGTTGAGSASSALGHAEPNHPSGHRIGRLQ